MQAALHTQVAELPSRVFSANNSRQATLFVQSLFQIESYFAAPSHCYPPILRDHYYHHNNMSLELRELRRSLERAQSANFVGRPLSAAQSEPRSAGIWRRRCGGDNWNVPGARLYGPRPTAPATLD